MGTKGRTWRPWTMAELEYVAMYFDEKGAKFVAHELNRSESTVRNKAVKVKIHSPFRAERRRAYAERFGLPHSMLKHYDPDILDRCVDDSARRLILGIGEKFGPESVMDAEDLRRLA